MKQSSAQILEVADGKPILLWTRGVPLEAQARQQLLDTARLPFIFKHLAVMPDVHLGKGSTIGSVIPPSAPSFRPPSAWTSAAA